MYSIIVLGKEVQCSRKKRFNKKSSKFKVQQKKFYVQGSKFNVEHRT